MALQVPVSLVLAWRPENGPMFFGPGEHKQRFLAAFWAPGVQAHRRKGFSGEARSGNRLAEQEHYSTKPAGTAAALMSMLPGPPLASAGGCPRVMLPCAAAVPRAWRHIPLAQQGGFSQRGWPGKQLR